jgi:hypothetical protein
MSPAALGHRVSPQNSLLAKIEGRWTLQILLCLRGGELRFTDLKAAYSLRSIGCFYRDYLRFMRHIDLVQPGAVHRVNHGRLVQDSKSEIRRLLEYIDVPFHPACLEFHKNRRSIATPSAEQVRRPLNGDGCDAWRPYDRWLQPLKEELGPAFDEWEDEVQTRSSPASP